MLYRQNTYYLLEYVLERRYLIELSGMHKDDFWLFHDVEDQEVMELRKFIDPEFDLSSIKGIDILIDKLYHLLE